MAQDTIVGDKNTLDYTSVNDVDVNLSAASTPLPPNPGVLSHVKSFFSNIFGDFYNGFRLVGYLAEINYSAVERFFIERMHIEEPKNFKPRFFWPDWQSKPRMAMNAIEATAFMAVAFAALFRDRKKLRSEVGSVIGAELGKDAKDINLKDVYNNDNPLLQTATNRSKGLYLLRLLQPLTFAWSSKLGISTTVFEIIAERAAYFEKNSYDQLQKLAKEVNINQQGTWSKAGITDRLVEVIQQNRAEHKALPIRAQDIEGYLPLLNTIATRMIEKKWHFAETLYVLGQIIKEPQASQKALEAYNDIEQYGLSGIAARRKNATRAAPVAASVATPPAAPDAMPRQEETPAPTGGFADKLALKSTAPRIPDMPAGSHVEKTARQAEQMAGAGIA